MAKKREITSNTGMLLLAIWLILTGLLQLVNLGIPAIGTLMSLLAIAAGIFVLINK